ncbi:MAG: DMT family transporter [Tissierellia bacterium]|nr:DMT family transporter [Tissierellia bacterium]
MERKLKGLLIILLCTFLWALNGNVGAWLFKEKAFSPQTLVPFRLLGSGLSLLVVNLLKNGPSSLKILRVKANYPYLLTYALIGVLLMQYSYFMAIFYSNAPTSTLIQYLGIFLITAYLAIGSRTLPSKQVFFSLFVSIGGVALLVTHGDLSQLAISSLALFWGLLSCLGYASANLAPIKLQAYYPSIDIVGPSMTLGGVTLLLVLRPDFSSLVWDLPASLGLLYCIFGGTLAPFTLFMEGQKRVGPQLSSIFSLTEAIFSTLIAVIIYKASFHPMDYVGMAMILSALVVLSLDDSQKKTSARSS